MRIEDVKIGMRVKYEHDGEVDYGVVKKIQGDFGIFGVEVWCDWEENGTYQWASPEHISPVEENTPKFKVGDKVVVVDTDGGLLSLGDIVTVSSVEKAADQADGYFYNFKEVPQGSGLFERRLAPYTKPKKTAEEIAPILWNTYRDVLNDEALAALRNVIEDVDNHYKCDFRDSDNVDKAFEWSETPQGAGLWLNVYDGKYDKDVDAVSSPETGLSCAVSASDTGSAATSSHYNSKLIQPIEIVQMVLTKEEFCGAMKFNIIKYSQRAGSKEGESSDKDWKKALQYKMWLDLAEQGVRINPREHVV